MLGTVWPTYFSPSMYWMTWFQHTHHPTLMPVCVCLEGRVGGWSSVISLHWTICLLPGGPTDLNIFVFLAVDFCWTSSRWISNSGTSLFLHSVPLHLSIKLWKMLVHIQSVHFPFSSILNINLISERFGRFSVLTSIFFLPQRKMHLEMGARRIQLMSAHTTRGLFLICLCGLRRPVCNPRHKPLCGAFHFAK